MADTFKLALDCISVIADFDGNDRSQLPEFIKQIEALDPIINSCENGFKQILFSFIKNKCTGKARLAIQNSDNIGSWIILRELLKKNFGEKQSVVELMDQLKQLQLNGSIENFYHKIKKIIHRINISRLSHDDCTYTIPEINRAALKTFKNHLPEPTRTLIIARNPQELDAAFDIVIEARHQHFTQFGPPPLNNGTKNENRYQNINQQYQQSTRNKNYHNNVDRNGYNHNYNHNNYSYNNNSNNNYKNNKNSEQIRSSNTRQTNNNYNRNINQNNSNNFYNNPSNNNFNRNNYNQMNNQNFYRNNNNQYNRQHNTLSQNTRRSNTIHSNESRQNLDSIEPMEIGQQGANFLAQASSNSHI